MVDFAPGVFPMFCSAPRARHSEKDSREEGPGGDGAACRRRHIVIFSKIREAQCCF